MTLAEAVTAETTTPLSPAAPPALTMTIFTKNQCAICDRTKTHFESKGVPFEYINVEEDTEPRAELGGVTAFEYVVTNYARQMPVVIVEDDLGWRDWWSGGRMDKWRDTVQLFDEAGLLIPEEQRVRA